MARLARIVNSALLLALCDAGDLSSITWKTQGAIDATETASETSFVASADDSTNSNYAYSELSNVVSFKVKPNYDSTLLKDAKVGFVCDGFFTETLYGTKSFGFATNPYPQVIFYKTGSPEITDPVMTLTATTEIEFKIDSDFVEVYICSDDTAASCAKRKAFPMGNLAAPSCRAKMTLSTNGAGFEVKNAVTLDVTTTNTTTMTTILATTNTSTLTTTMTATTTATTTRFTPVGDASKALPVSVSWMGAVPAAIAIATAQIV